MRKFPSALLLPLVIVLFAISGGTISSAASGGPEKSKPVVRVPLSQAQVKELKDIGVLVGRGDPFDKIESGWKSFLEKAKDVDVGAAVDVITREAAQEAARTLEPITKKLRQVDSLKEAISDELSRARGLLALSKQRKQNVMINKKEFEVSGEPPRVTVKPGEVLASRSEVAAYAKELEARLRSVEKDLRSVSMDLADMTQRRQAVMKNLPETAKKLQERGKRSELGALSGKHIEDWVRGARVQGVTKGKSGDM